MSTTNSLDKKCSLKKVWKIGAKHVIVIDAEIVRRLGISEDNTMFEQQLVDGNVLLKLVRKETS